MSHLTPRQRKIVSHQIEKEFKLKKSALSKRSSGRKLSDIEKLRVKRSREQNIRIGFEKAREIDESIPEFDGKDLN